MSLDSPSDKPKRSKPKHLEFDFDSTDLSTDTPSLDSTLPETSAPISSPTPSKSIHRPTERPFGHPISTDFKSSSTSSTPANTGGTALGAFRPASTVMPTKPISAVVTQPPVESPSTPTPEEPPMNSSIPSMSDFRRNAERQSKEQKSTGTILSGIAYGLIAAILLVASLSAFGGFVMWRQIQNNATTVAQVNDKLNAEVAALREEAAEARKATDEVIKRQQEQINRLTAVTEQQRGAFVAEQKKRDREIQALQAAIKRQDSRFSGTR